MPRYQIRASLQVEVEMWVEADSEEKAEELFNQNIGVSANFSDDNIEHGIEAETIDNVISVDVDEDHE